MIQEHRDKLVGGGVVHSFDGTMEEMQELVSLGLYIGINGCSLKTHENLQVAAAIPEDYLLIETDAPWCAIKASHAGFKHIKTTFPTKKKEKHEVGWMIKDRNEPCTLIHILEILSEVRGVDLIYLAEKTFQNSMKLFKFSAN